MKRIETGAIIVAMILLVAFLSAEAFAGGTGKTPRGRPFLELNGQILEIEGEISTLQDQVDSIQNQVATIEEKVLENEASIISLEDQNAALQAQIDAHATDMASIQAEIALLVAANATLQAQVDANSGDIEALQAEIITNNGLISSLEQTISELDVTLQEQIDNNAALIAAMETEIQVINTMLDLKQNILDGNCPEGQALQQINADGSIVCEIVGSDSIAKVQVTGYSRVAPSTELGMEARCPADYIATGGGFGAYPEGTVLGSYPGESGNGWSAYFYNNTDIQSHNFVYATCIKIVIPQP